LNVVDQKLLEPALAVIAPGKALLRGDVTVKVVVVGVVSTINGICRGSEIPDAEVQPAEKLDAPSKNIISPTARVCAEVVVSVVDPSVQEIVEASLSENAPITSPFPISRASSEYPPLSLDEYADPSHQRNFGGRRHPKCSLPSPMMLSSSRRSSDAG
jgi:hypothetical protein